MAKDQIRGWMHAPVTAVLGTRSKVAVLRVLWRSGAALPFREVVRRSGLAYGSIDLALRDLLLTGLVEEPPQDGRERRVRFRTGHRLAGAVTALFQVDGDFFPALRVQLRATAEAAKGDGMLGAAMVGAVSRRTESLSDPVDVVMVTTDAPALQRCLERFERAGDDIAARFGARIHVIGYDLATARTMWRTRTPAAAREVKDAELLAGIPLIELLDKT